MPHRPARRGFTLIELVIVLAILAAVTSLAWPNLRRMSAKSQIQEAGRQLRLALAQARLTAIEAGEIRYLRYRPETGVYQVIAPAAPEEEDGATEADAAEMPLADPAEREEEAVEQLPPGIVFLPPDAGEEPPSADVDSAPDGSGAPAESRQIDGLASSGDAAGWAEPVAFYPNGRTMDSRFRLGDGRRYYQDVILRGLTGTVQIGPVERYATEEGATPKPSEVP